jgi:hypothetical protein
LLDLFDSLFKGWKSYSETGISIVLDLFYFSCLYGSNLLFS